MKRPMRSPFRPLIAIIFMAATFIVHAETPRPKAATPPVAVKMVEPPIGMWTDQKTGLYIFVVPAKADPGEPLFTGSRHLQLGGPPPSKNKADDIFLEEKYERQGNGFLTTGTFAWDSAKNPVVV